MLIKSRKKNMKLIIMTSTFIFDNTSVFEGFSVTIKISTDLSYTAVCNECFRRLDNVLEQLNLTKLRQNLAKSNLVISDNRQLSENCTYKVSQFLYIDPDV